MRRIPVLHKTFSLIVLLLLSGFLRSESFGQATNIEKLSPREIAQQTLPSTVSLAMGRANSDLIKTGSGFFVSEDVVVTNYHVIEGTTEGFAKIYGQDKLYMVEGTVGVDEKNDLALLKIKGIRGKPLRLNFDDATAIGDEVFAVGNPKGLEGTFSQGIVSSIRKTEHRNLLQITASISHGSSGGPILNDDGQVIGVAVGAIESGQSLNFAIPVALLRLVILTQTPVQSLARTLVNSVSTKRIDSEITSRPSSPSRLVRWSAADPSGCCDRVADKNLIVTEYRNRDIYFLVAIDVNEFYGSNAWAGFNVSIKNLSTRRITVDPAKFILNITKPSVKTVKPWNPATLREMYAGTGQQIVTDVQLPFQTLFQDQNVTGVVFFDKRKLKVPVGYIFAFEIEDVKYEIPFGTESNLRP